MAVEPAFELADGLMQLDPVRTYPARAAQAVARYVGAAGYRLELLEGRTESGGTVNGTPAHTIALGEGREALGTLHLFGEGRTGEDEKKRATQAATLLARGLDVARRVAPDALRKQNDAIAAQVRRAPLTPRERDVVGLLVSGASTRTIATHTGLTISTVNTYLKRIFSKLGVHSRVELVARMAGTVPGAPPLRRPPTVGTTTA